MGSFSSNLDKVAHSSKEWVNSNIFDEWATYMYVQWKATPMGIWWKAISMKSLSTNYYKGQNSILSGRGVLSYHKSVIRFIAGSCNPFIFIKFYIIKIFHLH